MGVHRSMHYLRLVDRSDFRLHLLHLQSKQFKVIMIRLEIEHLTNARIALQLKRRLFLYHASDKLVFEECDAIEPVLALEPGTGAKTVFIHRCLRVLIKTKSAIFLEPKYKFSNFCINIDIDLSVVTSSQKLLISICFRVRPNSNEMQNCHANKLNEIKLKRIVCFTIELLRSKRRTSAAQTE
jgi:hypothetical protein